MTESRKIITAITVGAVAGLITGLLIAPEKGNVTRKRIADTTRKLTDNVTDFAKSGVSAMNTLKEKVFAKNNDVSSEGT